MGASAPSLAKADRRKQWEEQDIVGL